MFPRNLTTNDSIEGDEGLVHDLLYTLQGAVMCLANLIIVLAIYFDRALRRRKELLILSGLAIADFGVGMACLSAGIYRLQLSGKDLVHQWYCMLTVHNVIGVFSQPLTAAMLVLISADRLLSITKPFYYFQLGRSYAVTMLALVYTFALVCGSLGFWVSSMSRTPVSSVCFTRLATGRLYYEHLNGLCVCLGITSIILYLLVMCLYRHHHASLSSRAPGYELQLMQRQRRLTASLAISCCFTLVFYVVPQTALLVQSLMGLEGASFLLSGPVRSYLFVWTNLNALCNLFIFTIRHREIRRGVIKLFYPCKTITPQSSICQH